jgi:hypothetical protein
MLYEPQFFTQCVDSGALNRIAVHVSGPAHVIVRHADYDRAGLNETGELHSIAGGDQFKDDLG